jgi:hypothetical protein
MNPTLSDVNPAGQAGDFSGTATMGEKDYFMSLSLFQRPGDGEGG